MEWENEVGVFTYRIGSGLESLDIRTELVGLEKFRLDSDLIDGRVGSVRMDLDGLGSGWVKIMNFSIKFSGWSTGLVD